MSGNGMTGGPVSPRSETIISKKSFAVWIDSLLEQSPVIGPAWDGRRHVFRKIDAASELSMDYQTTMLSPGKLFIYKPKEDLFRFSVSGRTQIKEIPVVAEEQIIVGVHSCDTHALMYLDRTFLGAYTDRYYEARRKNTVIISLNCTGIAPNCFCSSVGTGPFLNADGGFDMLLTDFGDEYLLEARTERAHSFLKPAETKKAGSKEMKHKADREKSIHRMITKTLETDGLNDVLKDNPDHPLWRSTAEEKCLSCSNCVMVCPTCFCFDVIDEISMDMKTVTRRRQLDACQDRRFAEVHGGNYRSRRTARLRQFVMHKLNQTHQYGVFGTVGCGRCITWCPTGIDLTEMAMTIRGSG
jgi:sulfhydrogenase subunit beta (sulfur reductase)